MDSRSATGGTDRVRAFKSPGCGHLALEGHVGAAQARALHAAAAELAGTGLPVRADLGALRHVECAGVQVLLALDETLRRQGVALALESVPESVRLTLRSAGLGHLC